MKLVNSYVFTCSVSFRLWIFDPLSKQMVAAGIYFKPLFLILRKVRRCWGRPARRKTWNDVWFKQVERE